MLRRLGGAEKGFNREGSGTNEILLPLSTCHPEGEPCKEALWLPRIFRETEGSAPQVLTVLDVIVALLEKAGKPLGWEGLVRTLLVQGGSSRQVRYCIQGYLRNGSLTLYRGNKIGLPEWSTTSQ